MLQNGRLVWAHNGADFVMPQHVAVKVGYHAKGFNRTIGRTIDGAKKRFWFGKDRAEAQRKAAFVLNGNYSCNVTAKTRHGTNFPSPVSIVVFTSISC